MRNEPFFFLSSLSARARPVSSCRERHIIFLNEALKFKKTNAREYENTGWKFVLRRMVEGKMRRGDCKFRKCRKSLTLADTVKRVEINLDSDSGSLFVK